MLFGSSLHTARRREPQVSSIHHNDWFPRHWKKWRTLILLHSVIKLFLRKRTSLFLFPELLLFCSGRLEWVELLGVGAGVGCQEMVRFFWSSKLSHVSEMFQVDWSPRWLSPQNARFFCVVVHSLRSVHLLDEYTTWLALLRDRTW